MCGIVGVINKHSFGFSDSQVQMFSHLLYCDAVRGFDSTGVFAVNKYGNADWLKAKGLPTVVLGSKSFQEIAKSSVKNGQILIGHNRAASKGEVNDANAHPFVEEEIILVHNGTIWDHEKHAKTDVDSHAITKLIAEKGYKAAIKEINGAFTLIWYNAKEKKLYCVRNDKRPMHILETQAGYVLSSESKLAEWLIERDTFNNKILNSTECKPGTCYTWEIADCKTFQEEVVEFFTYPPTPKSTVVQMGFGGTSDDYSEYAEWWEKEDKRKPTGHKEESFRVGQIIKFEITNYLDCDKADKRKYTGILCGETEKNSTFIVKSLFTEEIWDLIAGESKVRGEITSIQSGKVPITLWIDPNSLKPEIIKRSFNDLEIEEDQWKYLPHNCTKCNKSVTFDDVEDCIVKVKPKKKVVICPACVAKFLNNQVASQERKAEQVALLH